MIENTYARDLERMGDGYHVPDHTVSTIAGVTVESLGYSVSEEGKHQLQMLAALTEQHRDAIEQAEIDADGQRWRCPDCGKRLIAHKAAWNTYGFDVSAPLEGENQPLLMWDSWQPTFHIAANWTPTEGLTLTEAVPT